MQNIIIVCSSSLSQRKIKKNLWDRGKARVTSKENFERNSIELLKLQFLWSANCVNLPCQARKTVTILHKKDCKLLTLVTSLSLIFAK